jgi:hypothetical protein
MDQAGNAVVAYDRQTLFGTSYMVCAVRVSASGVQSGGTLLSADDPEAFTPQVALAPTGGEYVVTYATNAGIELTWVSPDNVQLGRLGPVAGMDPAISIDGRGRFLVTYTKHNANSGSDDIYARRDVLA